MKKAKHVLLVSAWHTTNMTEAVTNYAVKAGWHLDMTFFISNELPANWTGDGIIVLLGSHQLLRKLAKIRHNCPMVSLTVNRHGLPIPYADADNVRIGTLAADYFLARNFHNFAAYGLTDWPVDRLRIGSFVRKITSAGHSCKRLIWQLMRGTRKDSWNNRRKWLRQQLQALPKPLAVFAIDDLRAAELIEAGLEQKLRIPEDMAVLGTGNHPILTNTTAVPLSSITIDDRRIGFEAARLLDRYMHKHKMAEESVLIPPSGIITRKSTDTIATEHPEISKAVQYMLQHYREPLGIPDIIAATALSQTKFYQAFRTEFGVSPAAFLTRIRTNRARQLLGETRLKITTIAQECGFDDSINLFRTFKRIEGISPKQYRDLHK